MRLKHDAPPIPRRSATAIQAVEKGKAIFVAAFPYVPTACPIKSWSTILYSALTSIPIMLGTANLNISFETDSVPRGLIFSSIIYLFHS